MPPLVALGAAALAVFALHTRTHVSRGRPAEALWACNVAALLLALGAAFHAPRLVAIGVLWLLFGTPLWALDLATGGEVLCSSFALHLGGVAVGVLAARELGWPRGSWWCATLAFCALAAVTRLITPAGANVNLAFAVWSGWEKRFPRHSTYLAGLIALATLVFFALDLLALRIFRPA